MSEWFLGADPDMHAQSIVTIDNDLNLVRLVMLKVSSRTTGIDAVGAMLDQLGNLLPDWVFGAHAAAVEGQEIVYTARSGKNPRSLLHLAYVSGGLVAKVSPGCMHTELVMPQKWKGSIDKLIHQRRICRKMGWEYKEADGYVIPDVDLDDVNTCGKINPGDWKHIMDSVGLALWARDEYIKRERKKRHLKGDRS